MDPVALPARRTRRRTIPPFAAVCRPRMLRRPRVPGALLLLLLQFLPVQSIALDRVAPHPRAVQAAFLRNFARYVTWPTDAPASASTTAHATAESVQPWRIGVLGPDPFGDILERTLSGRTEQGRAFEIVRAASLAELRACQIVYIALTDADQRRRAVSELQGSPVLTVSDAPAFLEEGGMVRFRVGDRVELGVNLDRARASSLTIQTKMLEVTREIIDGGTVRRRR